VHGLRRFAAISIVTAFVAGACGSPPPAPSSSAQITDVASPSAPAAAAFRPHFDPTPCPSDVTSDLVVKAACGYLTVLEDRTKSDGRTIQLFVIRVDPVNGTTTPDPDIFLGHLASQDGYGSMAEGGNRTHRTEYLIDPRGIGHSKPSLDCPEVAAAGPTLAGLRLRDPARTAVLLGAVRACHDRLVGQGIDLAAYDLAASAADIEDLRTTLGIASWNIATDGSASRLAFEVARRYPSGVRLMFMDSPSLPEPDFVTIGPAALDLAISRLFAACAVQPACNRGFPHLDAMIRAAEAQLDAQPLTFDVSGTVTAVQLGHPIRVVVDGAALVRLIRADLGSAGGAGAGEVARTVKTVLDGKLSADDQAVISLADDVGDCLGILTNCERPNLGALYSIVCRDFASQVDQSRLQASIDGRAAYADVFDPGPLLTPCAVWSVGSSPPEPTGPITGGVPTMIIRGAFDPFSTPLSEVSKAVAGLTNVYTLEIPNQSYNAGGFTECPGAIRNPWFDAPTIRPANTSCLGQIPAIPLAP
jgi:pimeloyl-ACP methyl ester carboxylesterase